MDIPDYTEAQCQIIQMPLSGRIFLQGPAGSGKSSAGAGRLQRMLEEGIPGHNILVLLPLRTLDRPYRQVLQDNHLPAGTPPDILTMSSLAQHMIGLYWPLIHEQAGFTRPDPAPSFLSLETAQFYLEGIVEAKREKKFFNTVRIEPSRLYSQILDNLNKSAGIGFPLEDIAGRLKSAWIGKPEQLHVYDEVQECALDFRRFCLENNLLDFSLQLEVFCQYLFRLPDCYDYLRERYRHLIYDNIEEDVPVTHDIVQSWLPDFQSALLIYDSNAGFRSFMGADPQTGAELCSGCEELVSFTQSLVTPQPVLSFQQELNALIERRPSATEPDPGINDCIHVRASSLFPQMIAEVCRRAADLVFRQQVPPSEIAVLAPFLSDSLRFSLAQGLEQLGVKSRSHRPSRSLQDEPATQCLLTFAKLAHPDWKLVPSRYEIRYALMQAIDELDLIRADLLSQMIYSERRMMDEGLSSFDHIRDAKMRERITERVGGRYQRLRDWLVEYRLGPPEELDIFLSRLFGELLSQDQYRFHLNYDSASVAARLVESVQKFRWATQATCNGLPCGKQYIELMERGLIAAQYLDPWYDQPEDAVLLAPAYTFLLYNRPVQVQFWLDIGSHGWSQRLNQPLTHPYILSRQWPLGRHWTQADEIAASQSALVRLVNGLALRCSGEIYLHSTGMNEQGEEQGGQLLMALNTLLRKNPALIEVDYD